MGVVSSLYLHVPFCRHLCNYCDFYKLPLNAPEENWRQYEEYLSQSLLRHESIMSERAMTWAPLETFYLGGGTPSLWGARGAEWLASRLPTTLAPEHETTLEIDPGAWDETGLAAWRRLGVNRFSVGTQSLDPRFLRVLDRAHEREETFRLLEALRGENFSVDFLLGAPHSADWKRDVLQELDELLGYGPSHVSLYILNPTGGYKLKSFLPDDEWSAREYQDVSAFLRARGMRHYEVSNFALPGREARHNLRYWHGESVAALGPTGTGYFSEGESGWRYKWKPSRGEIEAEPLSNKEVRLERVYLRMRLDEAFDPAELLPREAEAFHALLHRWAERGLAEGDKSWKLTPQGWVILDSLMDELFGVTTSL